MDPYAYIYGSRPPTAANDASDGATCDSGWYEPPLNTTTVVLHYDAPTIDATTGDASDAAAVGAAGAEALQDRLFTFSSVLTDAALTATLTTLVKEHWHHTLTPTVDVFRVSPSARLHHETITLRFTTPNTPTFPTP